MTDEQKAQAKVLWETTEKTGREIAKILGVSPNTISGLACRGGWTKHGKSPRPINDKIVAMRKAGVEANKVAVALGVTRDVVNGVVSRAVPDLRHRPDTAEPRTLFQRCDALAAKMDAVLAECSRIPRVPATTNQRPAMTWGLPRSVARGTLAND